MATLGPLEWITALECAAADISYGQFVIRRSGVTSYNSFSFYIPEAIGAPIFEGRTIRYFYANNNINNLFSGTDWVKSGPVVLPFHGSCGTPSIGSHYNCARYRFWTTSGGPQYTEITLATTVRITAVGSPDYDLCTLLLATPCSNNYTVVDGSTTWIFSEHVISGIAVHI